MIFLAPYQKILGFRSYYLSGKVDTFLSLKIWRIRNKMMIFYFQVGVEVVFFRRAKLCLSLNWWTHSVLASKQELCGNINDFVFFCDANRILVNEDHSLLVTSSVILHLWSWVHPAPLAFSFHAFPPLKPWWLSLFSERAALQILRTVESWSWNALAVSR